MSQGYNVTYRQKYTLYTSLYIRKIAPNSKIMASIVHWQLATCYIRTAHTCTLSSTP